MIDGLFQDLRIKGQWISYSDLIKDMWTKSHQKYEYLI